MSIVSIDHVQLGFAAAQWTVVRHFYTHLLGLPELNEVAPGRTLRLVAGAQRIDLVPTDPWQPPAPVGNAIELLEPLQGHAA